MASKYLEKTDYPLVLTVKDVQEILNVSQSVAYDIVHSKGFPLVPTVTSSIRIPRDKFFQWMDGEL